MALQFLRAADDNGQHRQGLRGFNDAANITSSLKDEALSVYRQVSIRDLKIALPYVCH
jgi:hypothetical protein